MGNGNKSLAFSAQCTTVVVQGGAIFRLAYVSVWGGLSLNSQLSTLRLSKTEKMIGGSALLAILWHLDPVFVPLSAALHIHISHLSGYPPVT